jgi:hypothetical protein
MLTSPLCHCCCLTVCKPGAGGSGCSTCSKGTYSLGGSTAECTSCTGNFDTVGTGAQSSSACSGEVVCWWDCQQSVSKGPVCQSTFQLAALSAILLTAPLCHCCRLAVCKPGAGGSGCSTCSKGTYSLGGSTTECTSCTGNFDTVGTGAQSSSACSGEVVCWGGCQWFTLDLALLLLLRFIPVRLALLTPTVLCLSFPSCVAATHSVQGRLWLSQLHPLSAGLLRCWVFFGLVFVLRGWSKHHWHRIHVSQQLHR